MGGDEGQRLSSPLQALPLISHSTARVENFMWSQHPPFPIDEHPCASSDPVTEPWDTTSLWHLQKLQKTWKWLCNGNQMRCPKTCFLEGFWLSSRTDNSPLVLLGTSLTRAHPAQRTVNSGLWLPASLIQLEHTALARMLIFLGERK